MDLPTESSELWRELESRRRLSSALSLNAQIVKHYFDFVMHVSERMKVFCRLFHFVRLILAGHQKMGTFWLCGTMTAT